MFSMTKLSVNVNKVATLRNTRAVGYPNVERAARICLDAGAHGITVHPRPDQRHIRPADVHAIAALLQRYPGTEYNIEGNPFHGLVEYARKVRPTQCTLVPDEVNVSTSDRGWDMRKDAERLRPVIEELHACGSRVSLFMDIGADEEAIRLARDVGAERIELYTGTYAERFAEEMGEASAAKYARVARWAEAAGLGMNAGHDLNLDNLGLFLRDVPNILEVSIGHAVISDALEFGLAETVRKYLRVIGANDKR
jgi:pyridoxine 5-phosphate synthase